MRLAYVDQDRASLDPSQTVFEAISGGLDHFRVGGREMPTRAYVATFGFKGTDQQKPVGVLSGGERNRLNLALTLREGGNLLLLDEPTNDLDVDTLRSLESALLDFAGCAVVISHDRWFLDRIATHMLAFEGDSRVVWFEGNFADYQADKVRRLGEATRPTGRRTGSWFGTRPRWFRCPGRWVRCSDGRAGVGARGVVPVRELAGWVGGVNSPGQGLRYRPPHARAQRRRDRRRPSAGQRDRGRVLRAWGELPGRAGRAL